MIGVNVIADHRAAYDYAAQGCRYFTVLSNPDVACGLKTQYPDAVVVHRSFVSNWKLDGTQLAAKMIEGITHPGVILETLNEADAYGYGSRKELGDRLDVELSAAAIVRARGMPVSLGAYSMGCPNLWDSEIIEPLKFRVAPLYNSDPGIYIGFHLYTRTWDRDFDFWYARRWTRLFEVCDFDPSLRKVLCSETGVDEGGVGGFPAHGYTLDQFRAWCTSWRECQAQPVAGKPSQLLGGALFQVGNGTDWAGYRVDSYLPGARDVMGWT